MKTRTNEMVRAGLKLHTAVRAGGSYLNHNETLPRRSKVGGRVRSGVRHPY